jgi:putative aldouronate transport system permease protein
MANNFSYAAAVNLFNSVVNCALLLLVNAITNKLSNREVSLF